MYKSGIMIYTSWYVVNMINITYKSWTVHGMGTGSAQKWSILSLIKFLSLHINFEVYFVASSLWLAENTINRFIGQITDPEILILLIFFSWFNGFLCCKYWSMDTPMGIASWPIGKCHFILYCDIFYHSHMFLCSWPGFSSVYYFYKKQQPLMRALLEWLSLKKTFFSGSFLFS